MKGIGNSFETIFGSSKQFAGFAFRMKRWFICSIKAAIEIVQKELKIKDKRSLILLAQRERIKEEFLKKWNFLLSHYTQKACSIACPCQDFNPHLFLIVEFSDPSEPKSYLFPQGVLENILLYAAKNFKDIIIFSEVSKGMFFLNFY